MLYTDHIYKNNLNLNWILQENVAEINAATASSNFINAFQIIAMSSDLDLSGLFEEQVKDLLKKKKKKIG